MSFLQSSTRDRLTENLDPDLKSLAENDDQSALVVAVCLQTQALRNLAIAVEAKFIMGSGPICPTGGPIVPEREGYFSVAYDVGQKIGVIKCVREHFGLALREAKELVEGSPTIKMKLSQSELDSFISKFSKEYSFTAWLGKSNESKVVNRPNATIPHEPIPAYKEFSGHLYGKQ